MGEGSERYDPSAFAQPVGAFDGFTGGPSVKINTGGGPFVEGETGEGKGRKPQIRFFTNIPCHRGVE
jgi:hypothetical protein